MRLTLLLQRCAAFLAGVGAALLALEAVLRCFETPVGPPSPAIAADRLDLPSVARRQLEEGVAISHFSTAGARLTGRPAIAGAPAVVIVGDSYVVAREVGDTETMGAWLEASARVQGIPLNVRQYGWRGASPARYLEVARQVLARWDPIRVVVPLSHDDLDQTALLGAPPQVRVDPVGFAYAVDTLEPRQFGDPPAFTVAALARLRYARLHLLPGRWERRLIRAAPVSAAPLDSSEQARQLEQLPSAVVRSLARAYGSRLTLVYIADVPLTGGDSTSAPERKMLAACREVGVMCLSTRAAMLAARHDGIVVRGFSTTEIGTGHLNAFGHRLVARLVWESLQPALAARRGAN